MRGLWTVLRKAYQQLEGIRLVAGADDSGQAAKAFADDFGVPAYGNAAELIARRDVDIVHIATPPSTHHALALACIAKGKHVLCEKPLAMSVTQADEMLAAAERAGVILAVNFVLRYNQVTHKVKELIDSGALGEVTAASLTNCAADSRLPPRTGSGTRMFRAAFSSSTASTFSTCTATGWARARWCGPTRHSAPAPGRRTASRASCSTSAERSRSITTPSTRSRPLDRTEHRLIFELGDLRVLGWIPLTIEIDAAVSDTSLQQLAACSPRLTLRPSASSDPASTRSWAAAAKHFITRQVHLSWTPKDDKQAVYAQSVRDLMSDQLAYLQNRSHRRIVSEENGRESLVLAEQAATLASPAWSLAGVRSG